MSDLIQELKRRNVFRVAIAYLVLAWVVLQITDLVAPALHLPDWTMSMVIFLGFVGFPFALLLAWAFELTPEGLKRSEDVELEESITGHTAGKLNQGTMALLVLAIVILVLDRQLGLSERWQPTSESTAKSVAAQTVSEEKAEVVGQPVQAAEDDEPESIAVLPFVNMSDDPSQEYFSDGISEELLNGLAKIRELRVAARTSSFAFKGKNQDITDIGQQLKVSTVLEGSVRKSGQRVRITAQLINVEDGYHLWSETYDRDLVDIFAVQDEISAAIVDALKVHLTDEQSAAPRQQVDLQAYNFVLQARHNVRMRTQDALELAVRQYKQALDIDENYAQAWAGMAIATSLLRESQYGDIPDDESYLLAQDYLDRAFAIDPDLFEAHAGQALVYLDREEPTKGLSSIDRALAINPSEGVLYLWQSFLLDQQGRFRDSTRALEKAYSVDPLHPSIRITWQERLAETGRAEEAKRLLTPGTYHSYRAEWLIARAEGRWADQYRILDEALQQDFTAGQREVLGRLMFFTQYFELYFPDLDWELAEDHFRDLTQALIDPDAVISNLGEREPTTLDENEEHELVVALLEKEMCIELETFLARKKIEGRAQYGLPVSNHSDEAYGIPLAWCLRYMGEVERAERLAGALIQPLDRALANGTPLYWPGLDYAALQWAAGDADAAVSTIGKLSDSGRFYYREYLQGPYMRPLSDKEDLRAIKAIHLARVNGERAALGLPAVEDTGL